MDENKYQELVENKELATLLGYETLRDILLPDLLGSNSNILYWAGKRLARKFNLAKDEDLPLFFTASNWGKLERVKAKRQQQLFKLSGPIVALRLKQKTPEFQLEAGFLAETIQNQVGFLTEAIIQSQDVRHGSVSILAQLDLSDPIDPAMMPTVKPLQLNSKSNSEQ
ncbi:MAG: YslB family protein [Liquorilactobacillus ghanensis]|jgi:predicted hydrocarbon binding protein|uniref:YslB family protein n=1 Tax=Liquorilactobacillus ghanensis TaxID=399370 RepID=UPI0039ECDC92